MIQKCAEVLVKVTQEDPGADHAEVQERREVHDFFFSQLVTVFRQNPQLIAPNPSQGKGKQKQQQAKSNYGRHVYDFLKKNMPQLELPQVKAEEDVEEHKTAGSAYDS